MNSIDQKIVEMKFDNSQFEAAVAKTMDTLDKFKNKLNFDGSEKGFSKLGKATSEYQYTLNDIGESITNLENMFSKMGTFGSKVFDRLTDSAVNFLFNGVGKVVSDIWSGGMSRAMNLEQAKFQLKGITKDAQRVNDIIYSEILPELQGTPFSLDQAAVVMGQLAASGRDQTEDIKQGTRAIAGVAAMTNRSFEEIGRVFTKVSGNGKVMGDTFQELSSRGLNAAADVAKYLNGVLDGTYKATEKVNDEMKILLEYTQSGDSFTEADIRSFTGNKNTKDIFSYDIFAGAMDTLYGSEAKKSTTMYTGALEDLKAALARIGAEPAAVKLEFLRDAFNALVPAVDAVNAVLKPFTSSTKKIIDTFDKDNNPIKDYGKEFSGSLAQNIQKAGWAFQSLFVTLDNNHDIMRFTEESIVDLQKEMRHIPEWVEYLNSGVSAGDAIMNPKMWKIITDLTKSFVNVLTAASKVVTAIGKGIAAAFPKITLSTIMNITSAIEKFTSGLILSENSLDRITWITRGIFTPLGLAVRTITSIVKTFIKILGLLYSALKPVVVLITSFMGMVGKVFSGVGVLIGNIARYISSITSASAIAISTMAKASPLAGIITTIRNRIYDLAKTLDSAGDKAFDFLSHISAVPILNSVITGVGSAISFVSSAIDTLIGKFRSFMGARGIPTDSLVGFAEALWKLSGLDLSKLAGFLAPFLGKVAQITGASSAVQVLATAFGFLSDKLGGFNFKPLKGVRKFFAEIGTITLDAFKKIVTGDFLLEQLKDTFKAVSSFKNIETEIKRIIETFNAFVGLLPKLLGFNSWTDTFAATVRKLGKGFVAFAKFLGLLGSGIAEDAGKGATLLGKGLGSLSKNIDSNFGKLGEILSVGADKIGEAIKKWLDNAGPNQIKKMILSLAMFGTCLYYLSTINKAATMFRGLTVVFEMLSKGIGALTSIAGSMAGIMRALQGAVAAVKIVIYMHAFAIALIGIAAAMLMISKIPPDRIMTSALVMVGILTGLGLIFTAVAVASKHITTMMPQTMLNIAIIIGSFAAAMLAIAGSLYVLAGIQSGLGRALGAVAAVLGMFTVMLVILEVIPRLVNLINPASSITMTGNLAKASWALVGIAAGIKALAEGIGALSKLADEGQLEAGLKATIQIMAMFSVFALAASASAKGLFSAGVGMIALSIALKQLGKLVKTFRDLDSGELSNVQVATNMILEMMMGLGLMVGAFTVLGKFGGPKYIGIIGTLVSAFLGLKLVADAIIQLGTQLDESQINSAKSALLGVMLVIAVIAGIASVGGMATAAAAGAMAAVGAGLFLLAEGIVALGNAGPEKLAQGMQGMAGALIALVGSLLVVSKVASKVLSPKAAASLLMMGGAMLLFAAAIALMASQPLDELVVSIIAVVGVLAIAGAVMTAFSAVSPGLLAVGAAFALLGIAALGLGAGIFLVTLALSALIPLITSLGGVDTDALADGIDVLKQAAEGLASVFDIVSASMFALAGAALALAVGFLAVGVGAAIIGVGFGVAAVGVFLLAGSLIILYETLATFFPMVVEPVENGLTALTTILTGELENMISGVSSATVQAEEEVNTAITEGNAKNVAAAEQGSQDLETAMGSWVPGFVENAENGKTDFTSIIGSIPGASGSEWAANSSQLTDPANMTMDNLEQILEDPSAMANGAGANVWNNYAKGQDSTKKKPVDATDMVMNAMKERFASHLPGWAERGAAVDQKMSGGISSNKGVVGNAAYSMSSYGASRAGDAYDDYWSAGSYAGEGFKSGLASKITAAGNVAIQLAQTAAAAAKAALQEQSPSKVFKEIGMYVGLGFIKGVEGTQLQAKHTTEDLVVGNMSAISEAMSKCATAFDSDMDFTPTITPVVDLTNVRQGVTSINSMFDSSFGLTTPYSNYAAVQAAALGMRETSDEFDAITKLAKEIGLMTDTMNSRQMINNINIEGSEDPNAFADALTRRFKLNARTM